MEPETADRLMELGAPARRRLLKDALEYGQFHCEIMKRLDAIEAKLQALSARGPAPEASQPKKEVADDFFLDGIKDILNGGI